MRACPSPAVAVCFFVLAILTVIPSAGAYGIGIGPTELRINDVLRGTSVERSITLFNLGDAESTIDLKTDGTAGTWITFFESDTKGAPITSVTLKARENRPVTVQIAIPSDTANGIYTSTIHATIKPPDTTSAQVGVVAIMEAVSTLSVGVTGEQNIAGTAEYIVVDDTEVNFPLTIRVLFHNTGNVAVTPEIVTTISGNAGAIDTISHAGTQVNAGKTDTIIVQWTKTTIEAGDYTADVNVMLGGTRIANKTTRFNLAPTGTLSRQGNLTSLAYEGDPVPDALLKITGTFENAGKIETKAKMIGEVYRDGSLVDSFASDELSIPVNDRGELTHYLKVSVPGDYTVRAYVLYEGKKTELKDLAFRVAGTAETGESTPLLPGLAISAVAGSIILAALYKRRPQ